MSYACISNHNLYSRVWEGVERTTKREKSAADGKYFKCSGSIRKTLEPNCCLSLLIAPSTLHYLLLYLFLAVIMMTTLKRLLHYDCLICVKQYRPPIKAYTLEFPAGTIFLALVATQFCKGRFLNQFSHIHSRF